MLDGSNEPLCRAGLHTIVILEVLCLPLNSMPRYAAGTHHVACLCREAMLGDWPGPRPGTFM